MTVVNVEFKTASRWQWSHQLTHWQFLLEGWMQYMQRGIYTPRED